MKTGIIDVGSNTVRLVVYQVNGQHFYEEFSMNAFFGVFDYVKEQKLSFQGIERLIGILKPMQVKMKEYSCQCVRCFATASLRSLKNAAQVIALVQYYTGITIQLIDGNEEALCDYYALRQEVNAESGLGCDLGGGSGQIFAFKQKKLNCFSSFPIGSQRLYKLFVEKNGFQKDSALQIVDYLAYYMNAFPKVEETDIFYFIGGTARVMKKVFNGIGFAGDLFETRMVRTVLEDILTDENYAKTIINQYAIGRERTLFPGMTAILFLAEHCCAKKIQVLQYGVREGYLLRNVLVLQEA